MSKVTRVKVLKPFMFGGKKRKPGAKVDMPAWDANYAIAQGDAEEVGGGSKPAGGAKAPRKPAARPSRASKKKATPRKAPAKTSTSPRGSRRK